MWTIIKFEKRRLIELKKDLSKKLGSSPEIYLPKLKIQKYKNNKIYNLDSYLLGDYLLCHHSEFDVVNITSTLRYCRGLKYFLSGFTTSQNEIIKFIKDCKDHEDNEGYVKQSFFDFENKQNFRFISGPFSEIIFKIISENQNKLKILINNLKVTVSKNKQYLFRPT